MSLTDVRDRVKVSSRDFTFSQSENKFLWLSSTRHTVTHVLWQSESNFSWGTEWLLVNSRDFYIYTCIYIYGVTSEFVFVSNSRELTVTEWKCEEKRTSENVRRDSPHIWTLWNQVVTHVKFEKTKSSHRGFSPLCDDLVFSNFDNFLCYRPCVQRILSVVTHV